MGMDGAELNCANYAARKFNRGRARRTRPVALSRREHFFPEQPSGFWIDQVHSCASRTSNRLVQIGFAISWLTFNPALHVQACIRAANL